MAKLDIKSAFRIATVHLEDRFLLGVQWDNRIYVDMVLPFGLRSAPKFSMQTHWCGLPNKRDEFITTGEPFFTECPSNLEVLLDTCRSLSVPIAEDKTVLLTTMITFLGIEID